MADLHITNGDGAANVIKSSCVSGDVLPWRDPMHHGPFPAGLDLDSVSKVRARYLGGADTESDEVGRDFQLRDAHLRAAADYPVLDPVFHQSVRTRLAVLLFVKARSFTQLKSELGITDGNLDAHLKKLSASGYLHSQMITEGRPHTIYQLSDSGTKAFKTYLKIMEKLIAQARGSTG